MLGQPRTASAWCLALQDSYPRNQGAKGSDTKVLVVWTKAFIMQCWIKLNGTIGIDSHYLTGKQSESGLLLRASFGVLYWKPWVGIQIGDPEQGTHKKNPEIGYISITLKYSNKMSLLISIKYTVWLQYYCSKEGLMPLDGADVLIMLQFLELAHSRVRPHAPGGKARPRVPEKFLLYYTCSTKWLGSYPGCPAPFGGNILYIGSDLALPNQYYCGK